MRIPCSYPSILRIESRSSQIRPRLLCECAARCIKITYRIIKYFPRNFPRFVFAVSRPFRSEFLSISAKSRLTMESYCAGDCFTWLCGVSKFVDCYADTYEMHCAIGSEHWTSARCSFLLFFFTIWVTHGRNIASHKPNSMQRMKWCAEGR